MTTKAQITANRTNAQKSTGPKTPQGKAAASQNSIKHGLLARQNVIMSESQEEFDLHRDLLLEELAPATPMESILADRIVSLSWRLKRTETIHTQTFDALDERNDNNPLAHLTKAFLPKPPKRDPALPELDLTLGRLVIKDFSNSRVLNRLLMYERRIESSLYKAMHELQKLKLIKNINTQHEASMNNDLELLPINGSLRGQAESTGATPALSEVEGSEVEGSEVEGNKNMRNEPNLQNAQKNLTSFPTSNYGKLRRRRRPKNEPKTNPISPKTNPICDPTSSKQQYYAAQATTLLCVASYSLEMTPIDSISTRYSGLPNCAPKTELTGGLSIKNGAYF